MLIVGPFQAVVRAPLVVVVPVVLHAVGLLPGNPLLGVRRGVHGVELVVEGPDALPLDFQVEVAVHVHQEVLEPIGGRRLGRQPVDVARVMFDHPPELELLVLPEVQLFRAQAVDLVLDQLLLVSQVVVVDRNELVGHVGEVVRGLTCRSDRGQVPHR